jgi:sulfite exporter TauE/SafE
MEFVIAFLTGLTTGGLSCLAVQGGLLASSIAHEVELSVQLRRPKGQNKGRRQAAPPARSGRPILLFLAAKLAAYTLLGFLLGWVGSVQQLTPLMRAVLQFAIGVFMIGTALRMLNVHPIFRYFVIEPPSFITRYIRRTAKTGENTVTPLFLGALTVLIPCGVTQAMMAVAMGTGNPLKGAALMFAFILGTSPVFFTVAYLASQLGAKLEANFMRFVAVVVLVLGFVSIESGLNLVGSPYSFSNLARAFTEPVQAAAPLADSSSAAVDTTSPDSPNTLTLRVENSGYSPSVLQAPANLSLKLELVTQNTYSCSRALVIPDLNLQKILPATGTTIIDLPPQARGTVMYYSCSMGMYGGQIVYK